MPMTARWHGSGDTKTEKLCAFSHTSPGLMVNPCACSHNNFDNEHSAFSARPVVPANASRMSWQVVEFGGPTLVEPRNGSMSSSTVAIDDNTGFGHPAMPMPMGCVPVVSTSSATRS